MEYPSDNTMTVPESNITHFYPYCPNGDLERPSQIFLICLNCCCFVMASGGNILVLLAIYKTRALRKISMYFLASLSSADLLVALTMNPLYIITLLIYNYEDEHLSANFFFILTKIENFAWVQTLTATTFSLCAVTIDRYIAVIYALRYSELITNQRCLIAVIFIWLFSFLFSSTLFFCSDFDCREIFWLVCSILTVAVPFGVIVLCNFKMAAVARRQVRQIQELSVAGDPGSSRSAARNESASNKKATITAIIVSSMFFVLFFPGMVVFAMLLVTEDECRAHELNIVWLWLATVSFLHSAFNPWVYCVRGKEFRAAIKKLLCNSRN